MMPVAGLHGVILAGGKSSRMGRDKAKLIYHGQDLIKRAVNVLETLCDEVWVSGRDAQEHGIVNPWFLDEAPGNGPLRGILTALKRIQAPCLVMPCDLPLMDVSTLLRLTTAYKHRSPDILRTAFIQEETGFVEALLAIYDPGCIPFIRASLAQASYKVAKAIPEAYCLHVPYSRVHSRAFLNLNAPQDLQILEQATGDFCLLPSPKQPRFRFTPSTSLP